MKRYLAIDIGASSGRHIVGWRDGDGVKTEEVYRFPNSVCRQGGHLVWDTESLVSNVKRGVALAKEKYDKIESLSVDTWGCDYVLLDGEREIAPCYAYRDGRTDASIPKVHEIVPFSELYSRTGIQFQPFNTVYQLYCDLVEGRLERATDFLHMPEYILWKLCGVKSHEYTIATTGGMVDAERGEYDFEIISKLGLPGKLFHKLDRPGEVIGVYDGIKCVLCATHDTASAVEGIPMDGNFPYISSGTWSLLGIKSALPVTNTESKLANWSNEGGVGYIRYQKNIMGMWLINRLKGEICPDLSFDDVTRAAEESRFEETVDVNSPVFLSPESMRSAFDETLREKPASFGDYFRCAYRSLALGYMNAIQELQHNTGEHYDRIYIVGGGAKNGYLNSLTEKASGKRVIALPIEATAIGNIKIQMEASK